MSVAALRKAELQDLPAIQKLFFDVVNAVAVNDYDQEQLRAWSSTIENEAAWIHKLRDQFFLVAVIENEIVGFASLEASDHIDLLYVHKDFQRQGIASSLFEALESESQQQGINLLRSEVSKTARGFFERKGFKVISPQVKRIGAVEIVNYCMEKKW